MRGKDVDLLCLEDIAGITPAYAGKRVSPKLGPLLLWDHPRVCGEKLNLIP